jgi:PAS domain S-box-containing protein
LDLNRLQRFFDISLGLLVTADEDGLRFADMNPVWESTLGWTREELRSRPFTEFIHPDDLQPTFDIIARMAEGEKAINFENRYLHKDGSWVWLSWAGVLRDGTFYAAARDVTDYKRAVEALEQANVELGQFAYAASHDLQEPLRAITGHLGFVNLEGMDTETRQSLEFVMAGAKRMKAIIDGLLEYSRIETAGARFEPVAMGGPLQGAMDALADAVRRSEAQIEIQGTLPTLPVDRSQITQVFQNLLANAIRYRKDGAHPEIVVRAERDGQGYTFSVADKGIGFEQGSDDRAFQIFQRLHRRSRFDGLGIGLALVKRIVQRHSGRAWIKSAVDEGTTAYIWLPERQAP